MNIPRSENANHNSRYVALDILRGLSIFLMLLVNNLGSAVGPGHWLAHANWMGGVHLADLVFPAFVFCLGVAIPFSAASSAAKKLTKKTFIWRVLRRFVLLMLLGFVVTSSHWNQLHFEMGILELIAVSYLVATLLYSLKTPYRMLSALGLLVSYWAIIKFVPYPGGHAGDFAEGHHIIDYLNQRYFAPVWLEGLPLALPTSALAIIGALVGDLVRNKRLQSVQRDLLLTLSGAVMIAAAYAWNLDMPFNKPLITPSYIILSAGISIITLVAISVVTDTLNFRRWAFPLIVFGSNAILAYVLPILIKEQIILKLHVSLQSWPATLLFTAFWWLLFYALYKKKLFVRV